MQVLFFLFRFIFGPVGHSYGLKSVVKKASPNPILEKAFKEKKSPSNDTIQVACFPFRKKMTPLNEDEGKTVYQF